MEKCDNHSKLESLLEIQQQQLDKLATIAGRSVNGRTILSGLGILIILMLATVSFLYTGQKDILAISNNNDREMVQKMDNVAFQEKIEREKISQKLEVIKDNQIAIRTQVDILVKSNNKEPRK